MYIFWTAEGYKGPTYGKLNSVYKDFFKLGTAPSRGSFPVSKLPGTISVEITFIATRDRTNKGRVVPDSAGPSPTSSNGGVLAGDTLTPPANRGRGDAGSADADLLKSISGILKWREWTLRQCGGRARLSQGHRADERHGRDLPRVFPRKSAGADHAAGVQQQQGYRCRWWRSDRSYRGKRFSGLGGSPDARKYLSHSSPPVHSDPTPLFHRAGSSRRPVSGCRSSALRARPDSRIAPCPARRTRHAAPAPGLRRPDIRSSE